MAIVEDAKNRASETFKMLGDAARGKRIMLTADARARLMRVLIVLINKALEGGLDPRTATGLLLLIRDADEVMVAQKAKKILKDLAPDGASAPIALPDTEKEKNKQLRVTSVVEDVPLMIRFPGFKFPIGTP